MTARNAVDPDLWWHLRTGEWIVETGHIPRTDPFSFTHAGYPWISHEWLSEVVFYELWKHGSAAALIAFSAIVTTAGFMLLYLRCPGRRHWAAAATVIGALAAAPSFGSRPQMFTFTLASLLLWLIERAEERPRLLFWIPPLFLLWVNLHAGFALGAALMIAYGIGLTLEAAIGATSWEEARTILLRLLLLVVVCAAIVALNPNGLQLYRYPFDTLRSPGMRSLIGEWQSPDFHQWLYRPLLLVWILLIVAIFCSRSRPKARVFIPLVMTAFMALDAVRHIPIFVLAALPLIASALRPNLTALPDSQRPSSSQFRPAFVAAIVLLMAMLAGVKWAVLVRDQNAREAKEFPQRAVAFLLANQAPNRMFVYYDWGGYAVWKLYPEYRVFVDGRADLYGDDLLHQFKTAVQLRNGWRRVLDDCGVDSVLLPPSAALAEGLRLDPAWRTAYSDSGTILLLRSAKRAQSVASSANNPKNP